MDSVAQISLCLLFNYQEGTCREKVCPNKVDCSLREPFPLQIVAKDDPEESKQEKEEKKAIRKHNSGSKSYHGTRIVVFWEGEGIHVEGVEGLKVYLSASFAIVEKRRCNPPIL